MKAKLTKAVKALEDHGGDVSAAARSLGLARSTYRGQLEAAELAGLKPPPPSSPNPPKGMTPTGVSILSGPDGEKQRWEKFKSEKNGPSLDQIIEQITASFKSYKGKSSRIPTPKIIEKDLASVYICADWHINMQAWGRETGRGDYDRKIAERIIGGSMSRLIAGTPHSSQAVVLGLGDLGHSDGYDPLTSRGKNILDVDSRYPLQLQTTVSLLMHVTDLALQKHKHILLRVLPGNHDDQSAIAVSLALSMFYSNNPRVTVDDDPGRFWWWSWGNVFLGATHGDKAKMKDLPLIMAASDPEAWGKAKFRHIYTGHIHTQTGIEMNGVTVESFQTPAAPDAWHVGMGYGGGRSVCSITHSKADGEVCRQKVNIIE